SRACSRARTSASSWCISPTEHDLEVIASDLPTRCPQLHDVAQARYILWPQPLAHSCSCSAPHMILPAGDLGRLSTNSTSFGHLKAHTLFLHQSRVSSTVVPSCPAASTTTALTVSPRRSSGAEMMQTSCTAGWPWSSAATSAGQTL